MIGTANGWVHAETIKPARMDGTTRERLSKLKFSDPRSYATMMVPMLNSLGVVII